MKTEARTGKSRRGTSAPAGRAKHGRRLPRGASLAAVAVLLGAAALWTWREPLELWHLQHGPAAGLEQYVGQHPGSIPALTALAEVYLREGRPEEAARRLSALPEQELADPDLRILLARAALQSGRPSQAYGHLQVVLSYLKPNDPEARWWLGRVLERSGRTDEAYREYQAVVASRPRDVPALLRLGHLAVEHGGMTAAEEYFRGAARAAPQSLEAATWHAESLFRLGRPGEAEEEARRALRLSPRDYRANFWLARSLQAADVQRSGAEAEAAFRTAIAAGEDRVTARYFLAKLLRDLGRTEEAAKELEENTRENPLHKESFYDLALCQRVLGRRDQAAAAIQRFRFLNSLDEDGLRLEYQVWIDPDSIPARLKLARFYLGHKRPDLARPQVERVLQQQPDHKEARSLVARIAASKQPHL